jgi:hypothetical protein
MKDAVLEVRGIESSQPANKNTHNHSAAIQDNAALMVNRNKKLTFDSLMVSLM